MNKWLLVLCLCAALSHAQTIQQAEYFVDTDPGMGSATPMTVSTPAGLVPLSATVATGALGSGLHTVNVRVRDNAGRWSRATSQYLVVAASTSTARQITTVEYALDNGSYTLLNPADSGVVNVNAVLATAGLSEGLHRLHVRCTDNLGRTSTVHDGFFAVGVNSSQVRLVTRLEYWFDSDAPTIVDVPDGATVPYSQIFASAGLPIGLHYFYLRAVDNTGRTGPATPSALIVTSPFGNPVAHTITAAEFFVNTDPGPGNGVAIPLPVDGVFDQSQESVDTVLTGLPIGLHVVGFRFRDSAGRWSLAGMDSLVVGPVLVIHAVGNDVVLDWQSGPGVDQYHIYRSTSVGGPFAVIDSTAATTYTDVGVIGLQPKEYYRVSFSTNTPSTFRLPDPEAIPQAR